MENSAYSSASFKQADAPKQNPIPDAIGELRPLVDRIQNLATRAKMALDRALYGADGPPSPGTSAGAEVAGSYGSGIEGQLRQLRVDMVKGLDDIEQSIDQLNSTL